MMLQTSVDTCQSGGTGGSGIATFSTVSPTGYQCCLIGASHLRRKKVENFIANRFATQHNASINNFMPYLMAIYKNGEIKAALGIRPASHESLFLEHYLDDSIEQKITLQHKLDANTLAREQIVEIGNLASTSSVSTRYLFQVLAAYLLQQKYQWVAMTGCKALQRAFNRMRLNICSLGLADQARVPANLGIWGSYYDNAPEVMIGRVSSAWGLAHKALLQLHPG